ncbi:hypothetical protein HDU67_009666 [Dinochytrium kinnereticum]|nr:hypothetical protein HDU67_009666 [Dinochytrium kinnereticum]
MAHRVPRIGDNSKNRSSDIFTFGGPHGFQNEADRYKTNVSEEEQMRREKDREHRNERVSFRRQWKADLESDRWSKMAEDFNKVEEQWQRRHKASRIGKNSVSYNPITLEYHESDGGKKLAEEDAKSLYRTAMRSAHLYLKNNTFNPMRCQDIPRRLVADLSPHIKTLPPITDQASEAAERKASSAENPNVTLDIPRQLIAVAAHSAALVKGRMGNGADDVLLMGKGTPRRGTAVGKEGREGRFISVEVEGEGKDHNWSRHF